MARKVYSIYSHADADGGIAAAIFALFIQEKHRSSGWDTEVIPVNHGAQHTDWAQSEVKWPAAILDFSIHPLFLNDRFFFAKNAAETERKEHSPTVPECYWIDHHPTGATYSFLTAENITTLLPHVRAKWDVKSVSTPGLLRTWHEELGLPRQLMERYEEYIDLAEIIDGALFATAEDAHDFHSPAVRLQTLFSTTHPAIQSVGLYKHLVKLIMKSNSPADLFDADPLFMGIIEHERRLFCKQLHCYEAVTQCRGKVAISNFMNGGRYSGLGRFIPYVLFPEVEYAIHVLPKHNHSSMISCGVNPWNKPSTDSVKHLGHYFSQNFGGGGHAFVAGGRVNENESKRIDDLIAYLE